MRRRHAKALIGAACLCVALLLWSEFFLFSVAPEEDINILPLQQQRRSVSARARFLSLRHRPQHTLGASSNSSKCSSMPPRPPPSLLADHHALITVGGRCRFTVLSSRTVRIEHVPTWGASDSFDDRASTAIVNRRMQFAPEYQARVGPCTLLNSALRCLIIETAHLRLEQAAPLNASWLKPRPEGGFRAEWSPPRPSAASLRVRIRMGVGVEAPDVGWTEWWPGKPNPGLLPGTIRTLDKTHGPTELRCSALPESQGAGQADDAHCEMGLVSRDGWALFDDSERARLDAGTWPWAAPRDLQNYAAELSSRVDDGDARCAQWAGSGECTRNVAFMLSTCKAACERAAARVAMNAEGLIDWYLFGAGLDFRAALRDLAALSGAQPVPPRYAFGTWFSRWWPWADFEAQSLLREFEAQSIPLDVLITDMDWHPTCYRRTYGSESEKRMDASGNWPCWSGFSWDKKYYATPDEFLAYCKALGIHNGLNLHFQSGVQQEEDAWPAFRRAMGLPASATFAPFDPLNQTYSAHFHTHVLAPLERQGVDFWWLDWQQVCLNLSHPKPLTEPLTSH